MSNRMIKSANRQSSRELQLCLAAFFSLELLAPSSQLYIFSPWLSNMTLIDNRFGQFRALYPDDGQDEWRLVEILNRLALRETSICILCRPNEARNEQVIRLLNRSIQVRYVKTLHEKGIVTEQFYWRGSMNVTYFGVNVNDESIEITTDPESVNIALLEAKNRWGTLG